MGKAVQSLLTTDLAQAASELSQASKTADERAMDKLRDMSAEFMPALAIIRNAAVDRDVLGRLEEANSENSLSSADANSTNSSAKKAATTPSSAHVASPARKRARRGVDKSPCGDAVVETSSQFDAADSFNGAERVLESSEAS